MSTPALDYATLADSIGYPRKPRYGVAPHIAATVPGLPEALDAYRLADDEADNALLAIEEYRDDVRRQRAAREAAIRAAGQAQAAGRKRPSIPSAPSEDEEATEVHVLVEAARIKKAAADRAALAVDRVVEAHADTIARAVLPAYTPAVAKAQALLAQARESVAEADGLRRSVLALRAAALVASADRPLSDYDRARLVEALERGADPGRQLAYTEARSEPWTLLDGLTNYLNALAAVDLLAGAAHPHMLPATVDRDRAMRRADD